MNCQLQKGSQNRIIFAAFGLVILTFLLSAHQVYGQIGRSHDKNNPYAPNPGQAVKAEKSVIPLATPASEKVSFMMAPPSKTLRSESGSAAQPFRNTVINVPKLLSPSEVYKIGVGDVLYVNLKNSPNGSGYYTVLPDETIEYALAGERVRVANFTVEQAAAAIAAGIKLFREPSVEVKVREFGSHKVMVSGSVSRPGEKNLQREAIPLFVIRAEAMTEPGVKSVAIVKQGSNKRQTYDLTDSATDNLLIEPGDEIDFISPSSRRDSAFYFISGNKIPSGQKELAQGMTLYQAVIALGTVKNEPKKAVLRRKSENGVLSTFEHDLKAIRKGKAPDPLLAPGDVIEIKS